MSYILEALKKVEREQELDHIPGLHSRHDAPSKRTPRRWPWVVAAALLLTAVLVALLWWRGVNVPGRDTQEARRSPGPTVEGVPGPVDRPRPSASQTRPVPQSSIAGQSTSNSRPLSQTGAAAAPEDKDRQDVTAKASAPPPLRMPPRPLRPLPLADPLPAPGLVPSTALPLEAEEPGVPDPLPPRTLGPVTPPEIVELRPPAVEPQLQEEPEWKKLPLWPLVPSRIAGQVNGRLVLNAHVYSEHPEDRFVLLNMKKYTAGQQISEGPALEEITREGVILAVPEGRFRLKSQ
jgi:general secretion pathway protein B